MKKYLIFIIIFIIYFIYSSYTLKKDVEKSILATDKIKVCGKYLGIKTSPGATRAGPKDYITFQNDDGSISQFHSIPRYQNELFGTSGRPWARNSPWVPRKGPMGPSPLGPLRSLGSP